MGIPVTVYEEARLGTARLLLAVRDHLKEIRPDILHSHRYKEHILGAIAGKLSNDPLTVQTYHGLEESLGGWAGLKMKAYNGINLVVGRATADGIVGVSSDITHVLERRYPSAHVRCIRNGIDLARTLATEGRSAVRARLGLAPETFVVGTVGRLTPIKGFEHLIEAFAQLRQQARVQDSRLVIVGDGPSRAILEQLAESHRVPAYVKFLGTRTDVYNLISAFDVFALSSLHEGVPMVLLEAMALQVPIVASRVGGIPEILEDGVEAALVPPKDPEALTKAIAVLAQSPELRAQRVRALASRG
jgi:glycosyltransferase involved in cell wall biosynthesis